MRYQYQTQVALIRELCCLEVGDLVTTVMGEIGIIVGKGPHADYMKDQTQYYYVLVEGFVYHYVSAGLKKIKN